jgi:ubiquitin C-terminal hydrolase
MKKSKTKIKKLNNKETAEKNKKEKKDESKKTQKKQESKIIKEENKNNKNQKKKNNNKSKKDLPKGLINLGYTCYMNSILQCFFHIKKFRDYFISNKNSFKADQTLSQSLSKILDELENGKEQSIKPIQFKEAIGEINTLFLGKKPADAKDLFFNIIDCLINELSSSEEPKFSEEPCCSNKENMFKEAQNEVDENCIINQLFVGYYETIHLCPIKHKNIYSFQNESFILFELEKIKDYFDKKDLSLDLCFQYYYRIIPKDSFFCGLCKKIHESECCNKIYRLPEILVIILDRGHGKIFDGNVSFEHTLDLKYLIDEKNYKYNSSYKLICVSTHAGDSSEKGHYTACCLNDKNGYYYYFSDDYVIKIEENELNDDEPYLLFYQREEINNNYNIDNNKKDEKEIKKKEEVNTFSDTEEESIININKNNHIINDNFTNKRQNLIKDENKTNKIQSKGRKKFKKNIMNEENPNIIIKEKINNSDFDNSIIEEKKIHKTINSESYSKKIEKENKKDDDSLNINQSKNKENSNNNISMKNNNNNSLDDIRNKKIKMIKVQEKKKIIADVFQIFLEEKNDKYNIDYESQKDKNPLIWKVSFNKQQKGSKRIKKINCILDFRHLRIKNLSDLTNIEGNYQKFDFIYNKNISFFANLKKYFEFLYNYLIIW